MEEKPKTEQKKRGGKSKDELEQYLVKKAEVEANLPLYEKKIEDQLGIPLAGPRAKIPQNPQWGIRSIAMGKTYFCTAIKLT